ncbi:MAG TPA: hypothetical protein VMW75_01585 [Thermoanaerobaculia bacterium]|nr:hypothetical protein [Thermoanaerobaculia bacterium]
MPDDAAARLPIDRALGWILAHLDLFDPFRGGRPFAIKHGQRLGEIAILLHAYTGITGERESPAMGRIVSLLESVRARRELGDRLLRSPAELVLFVEIYAALRSVGHDDPGDRVLIQRALDARLPQQLERLPHRMMDIASCLEWGGFAHRWPSLRRLYGASILGATPSALLLSEDGMYGLTHVLMYLYGFGLRRASIPRRQRESLRRLLSMLLVGVGQDRHWDLLAELLLCWEAIGYPPTALADRAWEALLAAQQEDGSIPGPEWARPIYEAASRDVRQDAEGVREAYFAHHYHTTLVAIIAACLRRRNLAAPAARSRQRRPARAPSPGLAPPVPGLREASAAAAGWLQGVLDTLCRAPGAPAEDLYRTLLGLHFADALAATGAVPEAARRVASRLAGAPPAAATAAGPAPADGPGTRAVRAPSPALTFCAAALLAGEGLFVPGLHAPAGLPAAAARLLAQLPEDYGDGAGADGAGEAPELYEKRALLAAMGLLPAPRGLDLAPVLTRALALPLTAPWEAWDDLLQRIDAATACGVRPPRWLAGDPGRIDLEQLLAGKAMHLLRRYDLPRGARMLRGMAYLGLTGEPWRDCLRFLLLHQRLDGAFGFYGLEERKLREAAPGFCATLDLSLVVTVECLWTLAESTGWRLLASFPPARLDGPAVPAPRRRRALPRPQRRLRREDLRVC